MARVTRVTRLLAACGLLAMACVSAIPPASTAQGSPIALGMIHADRRSDALAAARVAVDFVNTERRGVAGRSLKLEACATRGTAESSSECAQKMVDLKVLAVAYDVDDNVEASVGVLQRAGLPVVGAAPTSNALLKAPNAFVFNAGIGGSYASMSAFAARNLGARKVALIVENEAVTTPAARAFGESVLKAFGVRDVTLVRVAPSSGGLAGTMRAVTGLRPDVVIAAPQETTCADVMKAVHGLTIRPRAVYSGTCLAPDLLKAAGAAAENAYFETPVVPPDDAEDARLETFRRAVAKHGAGAIPIIPRTQIAFQSVMNLIDVVNRMGAPVTSDRVTAALRQSKGWPNFMGHPYTCDGKQAPALPAVCTPHTRVVQYRAGRLVEITGDWLNPF